MQRGLSAVRAALTPLGLVERGWFWPKAGDQVPLIDGVLRPGTILLVGHLGGTLWDPFRNDPDPADPVHPLDHWTRSHLSRVAAALGVGVCFPFDGPPFWPFPTWAKRADSVFDSPLGLLIHPRHGLWHAYRGALLLPHRWPAPVRRSSPSPCVRCADRPCLTACPVTAFGPGGLRLERCLWHLRAETGRECLDQGCRARAACPVGRESIYSLEQIRFHMRAFVESRIS
ncbi:MAG: 4Fe-4S dicluster domain-containing protein [Magnetococcales bacterium]|nr:4Fe-4S dicluster domain-containing protein [Magnetococcales bacterium]